MKKQIFALVLLLVLLLAAFPVSADGISITAIEPRSNGNVLVRWEDPAGNSPYIVAYHHMEGDKLFSLQLVERNVQRTEIEIGDLIPGEKYSILVLDKDFNMAQKETSSETRLFGGDNSSTRLTVTLRQKKGGSASTVKQLSVAEIEKTLSGSSDYFGATIKATLPRLSKSYTGIARAAIRQPDGDMFTFLMQEEKMLPSYEYIYYDNMSLTQVWRYIKQQNNDTIPTGTYTISFYLDQEYFGYQDFTMVP